MDKSDEFFARFRMAGCPLRTLEADRKVPDTEPTGYG